MPRLCRVDLDRREQVYEELLAFVRRLKDDLPVSKVYLHGSFATGRIHEGSDIDLVIVGDFEERLFDRIDRVLQMTSLPIEPLVYTPEEFDGMVESKNPFILHVLREGKEL